VQVGQALTRWASLTPDRPALISDAETLDFAGWNQRANALAEWLAERGVGAGQAVAISLPNGLDFPVVYAAVMKVGAIAMPIDPRLAEDELDALLVDAGARVAFVHTSLDARRAIGRRAEVVEVGTPAWAERLAAAGAAPEVAAAPKQSDPALYLHTSGTTGRPRVVELSYANLDCFPAVMSWAIGTDASDVALMALPMSHISGPVVLDEVLDKGCSLVVIDPVTPAGLLAAISRHRVTWMHSVPPLYQGMLRALSPEHDLSSLRMAAMMGTSVPLEILRALARACPRAKVIQGYGLTETSPLLTLLPLADAERKLGSVGRAAPGAELRLLDPEGGEVPPDTPGELVARGPMLMTGYLNDPQATRARIRDGALYTGDIMLRDAEGYFYHLGRADDLIVTGRGLNVYPAEVENALLTHPEVRDVAAAGVQEAEGLVVKAWVVRVPGSSLNESELRRHCAQRLASFKRPKRVAFVDAIPRNAMNKVLRSQLP